MYDQILLPTDGSPGMATAIQNCTHLAAQNDSTLHLLYVVDVRAYIMLPDDQQERIRALLTEDGTAAVEALAKHAEERGIEVEAEVIEGVPHDAIISYADDHDIDLIVMGTHGRTGESKRIVGSVAEEVVRSAAIPVLTAPMTDEDLEEFDDETIQEPPEEQRRYIT